MAAGFDGCRSGFCPEGWPGVVGQSGGAAFSASMIQFVDRLPVIPVPAVQTLYQNLFNYIEPDGTLAKLDVLAITAVDDAGNSLINLPNGTFLPDLWHASGVPAWTQYRGWTGTGTNACVRSGHTLGGAGGNYAQNSAMVYAVTDSAAAGNHPLWATDADVNVELWPKFTSNTLSMANNSSGEDSTANASGTDGRWMTNRAGSANYRLLRNGGLVATITKGTTTPETGNMKIGIGVFRIMAFAVGAGLTTGQETTLDTAVFNFLHDPAIGAL